VEARDLVVAARDPAAAAWGGGSGDRGVEQMAHMRRKSEGEGGEEPGVAWGRTKGASGGSQHRAEGRKVPFYSGSQLGLCLVGFAALVGCFMFS
jgi:hypothetical protein